jgi:hypothetical protein
MRTSIIGAFATWLVLAPAALAAPIQDASRATLEDHARPVATSLAARVESRRSDAAAWLISTDGLHAIDPNGEIRQSVDLAANGFGAAQSIAVDPYDDSVWVATDASLLLHFAADASLVQGASLPTPASALGVDLDRSVWLVAGDRLLHFSPNGDSLATRALPWSPGESVTGIAADALRDRVWLATTQALYRVDQENVRDVLRGETLDLALDPRSGNVLSIVDGALAVIIGDEAHALDALAFVDDDWPVSVAYDAEQASFVVDTLRITLRLDTMGRVIESGQAETRATLRPFRIEPTIELLRPPRGGVISETVDEIVVRVGARCGAMPCDIPEYAGRMQVTATLDGATLTRALPDSAGYVHWPVTLDGRADGHRFGASVRDRFGRFAAIDEARWTFVAGARAADAASPGDPRPSADVQVKAANKPPSVSLTSPQSGSLFTAGGNVMLTASATDPDGSILKVEFYRGGTTLVGTATTAPYQFIWTSVPAGTYSLTAKAYDNRNGTATSAAVSISVVNNLAPNVSLVAPAAGSFVPSGTVTSVVANANDPDGVIARVEFFDNGMSIGLASAAPFELAWTPAQAGMHTLEARATDDKGASATSMPVDVIVGTPPVIVVTSPVACSFLDGPLDVMLAADAISGSGSVASVEFFDNDVSVGKVTSRPWRFTLANVQRGTHSITARATDDHGLATMSRPSLFTVRAPNVMPAVNLTSPLDGSHVPIGSSVTLTASASDSDGTISAVEFRQGATVIGRVSVPPYATTWKPSAAGAYSLVAVATDDRNGSTTSGIVRVTVDPNVLPTVSLTAPTANASFAAPASIALQATASDTDGTVAKVEFLANGALVGSATAPPYAITWNNVAAGSYSLTARATDNAGGVRTSSAVSITVTPNSAPTVTLTSPNSGQFFFSPATIPISATASDPDGTVAKVEFLANGVLIGTATSAPYGFVWDAVTGGSYSITAVATDDRGAAKTSSSISINVQAAPTLTFDGSLGATTVDDDRVLVQGFVNAPANSAVTVNGIVTHIDDRGFFQANDVPLTPGSNPIVAVVTTQDGQTTSQSVTVESSGPGLFVVNASPTEGLETLQVTFTVENPNNVAFNQILFDLDTYGYPDWIATPADFHDGKFALNATYPVGTWTATIKVLDDQDRVIYTTRKSIVVLMPQALQGNVVAIYENMLLRLKAGNIDGALTAFTGSAYEKFKDIFTQLRPDLVQVIDQLGTVAEVTFNLNVAELTLVRDGPEGPQRFMIYLIRAEDGIWRIDGM